MHTYISRANRVLQMFSRREHFRRLSRENKKETERTNNLSGERERKREREKERKRERERETRAKVKRKQKEKEDTGRKENMHRLPGIYAYVPPRCH